MLLKFRLLAIVVVSVIIISSAQSEKINVGITHFNDVLGYFQQYTPESISTGSPKMCTEDMTGCIGGIARISAHINYTEENDFSDINVNSRLVLTPGNLVSAENGWLTLLEERFNSWVEFGKVLTTKWPWSFDVERNYFRPSAMSLGVKEFTGGLTSLHDYLTRTGIRPVVSNMNCPTFSTDLQQSVCNLVDSFRILTLENNFRVGLVGFVDPLVVHHAEPGNLEFHRVSESLSAVVEQHLQSVSAVIAVGTGSLDIAKSILDAVPKIKLVLYGGKNYNLERYPFNYKGGYIATAGKYGSTLGKLRFSFDTETGEFSDMSGSLVETDAENVELNEVVVTTVRQDFVQRAESPENLNTVARGKVNLDGLTSTCWKGQCSLGAIVTDAMVHCAFKNLTSEAPSSLHAVWHSGGLGNVFYYPNVDINKVDLSKWLPYSNDVVMITLLGKDLITMFEKSASGLDTNGNVRWGQFLQVSAGMEVHYTIQNGNGTLKSVGTMELVDDVLTLVPVEGTNRYYIVVSSFLQNGRNVFHDLPGAVIGRANIGKDSACLQNYIKDLGVLRPRNYQRIYID